MRKNKYVFYSLIALPLLFGILYPIIFIFSLNTEAATLTHSQLLAGATQYVDLATILLVVISGFLPSYIASYSFVGEKIEKSLEPLLATPTTDGELLLGKCLGAFLPCISATYVGAVISASILDAWSLSKLGILVIPSLYWALAILVIAPLACILSVEANVIVSSKVNDIRAAQQLGGLISIPLIILIFIAIASAQLSTLLAALFSVILAVADITLFYLSKETFQREEILTKWK
jgi:ABC-type Na+ efflux pump permease subunit